MVVFTPDRIFCWRSGTGGPAPLDEEKPKAGWERSSPGRPASPVLSEIHQMIGINPGRIIKSRPRSPSGMAFFPGVVDRFSNVAVAWPAI